MKFFIYNIAIVSIMFLFSGCFGGPTHIDLNLKPTKTMNTNVAGQPSPLVFYIYELSDNVPFNKLDYDRLSEDPKKHLSESLNGYAKHIITPSEEQTYKILPNPTTKYLGITGSFRNMDDNGGWKQVFQLKLEKYNKIDLTVENNKLKEIK